MMTSEVVRSVLVRVDSLEGPQVCDSMRVSSSVTTRNRGTPGTTVIRRGRTLPLVTILHRTRPTSIGNVGEVGTPKRR